MDLLHGDKAGNLINTPGEAVPRRLSLSAHRAYILVGRIPDLMGATQLHRQENA